MPHDAPARETFRLKARGIRKSFGGVEVLHGVDLDASGGSVLALLGENGAGKSTLVRIVAGDHAPDDGEIVIGGESHRALDPVTARALGVRMIFQELSDAPALSVAENISLGRWPAKRGVVRWRTVRERALRALDELGVELDPDQPVATLRIGERQAVEIARAMSDRARCLILDEPTAALSGQEVDRLFAAVRRLRERGTAIVYITHRLDEVVRIADRVEVLRDGSVVLEREVAGTSRADLVTAMVGREVGEVTRPEPRAVDAQAAPVLAFSDAACDGAFSGVDLAVRPGEVVAIYGKLGSGIAEVAEVAFGLRRLSAGSCELKGAPHDPGAPHAAIAAGVGLVPADRQREGAFMVRSVAENISVPSWGRLARRGLLHRGSEARAYRRWHDELSIRSRNDPEQLINTLSGGNQQKVVLGRWLERRSDVLALIEPTRGVDVGARMEIYREIRKLAGDGLGVLVATSDYEEVVQLADRAAVMARGRVVGELGGDEITTQRLTELAGG
jgi:ribose transport system ATP-binding protein